MSKLIIIRGPSGAGKTTLAKALLKACSRPTMLLSIDQIRKMFNDHHLPNHNASKVIAKNQAAYALGNGYDVIFEGILGEKMLGMLDETIKIHEKENYYFYLDVKWDETLKRHHGRPEKSEFGEKEMKEWWDLASPMGHEKEVLIPQSSSLEKAVRIIGQTAGLKLSKPA